MLMPISSQVLNFVPLQTCRDARIFYSISFYLYKWWQPFIYRWKIWFPMLLVELEVMVATKDIHCYCCFLKYIITFYIGNILWIIKAKNYLCQADSYLVRHNRFFFLIGLNTATLCLYRCGHIIVRTCFDNLWLRTWNRVKLFVSVLEDTCKYVAFCNKDFPFGYSARYMTISVRF